MAKAREVVLIPCIIKPLLVIAVLIRMTARSGPGISLFESEIAAFQQPTKLEPAPPLTRTMRHHHNQPSFFSSTIPFGLKSLLGFERIVELSFEIE
jgi:hypothetical protein